MSSAIEYDKSISKLSDLLEDLSTKFDEAFACLPDLDDVVDKPKSFDGLSKKQRREKAKEILKAKYPKIWNALNNLNELSECIFILGDEVNEKIEKAQDELGSIESELDDFESQKEELKNRVDSL